MAVEILQRQTQESRHSDSFERRFSRQRLGHVDVSKETYIESKHEGGIASLALDTIESRYLLAAASDSSFCGYDTTLNASPPPANPDKSQGLEEESQCLFRVDRNSSDGHAFAVTSAIWYPVDTGLLVTGSADNTVKVWDSNQLQAACTFSLPVQVNVVAMSPCAASHCLIAVGAADPEIRLCDPQSGSFSHTLLGHKNKVWSVAWSLQSEWQLLSGGCDGQVRAWDIRSSGCIDMLDQYSTKAKPKDHSKRKRAQTIGVYDQQVSASAHEGSITAVKATADGLHWITAGTDSRVRLWDASSFRNKLVNYRQTANRAMKARQIAVAESAKLLFHPSGSIIQCFEILTGQHLYNLKGHMDAVNACCFNQAIQELYTGSNDHQICTWAAVTNTRTEEDDWSS